MWLYYMAGEKPHTIEWWECDCYDQWWRYGKDGATSLGVSVT